MQSGKGLGDRNESASVFRTNLQVDRRRGNQRAREARECMSAVSRGTGSLGERSFAVSRFRTTLERLLVPLRAPERLDRCAAWCRSAIAAMGQAEVGRRSGYLRVRGRISDSLAGALAAARRSDTLLRR